MANSPQLLDQVRELLRIKHYALKIVEVYVNWIRRFILYSLTYLPVYWDYHPA